jgi:hypothetical protein
MLKFAENQIHVAVIQFPVGTYGYAGFKIPAELRYDNTPEEIAKFGSILPRMLKTRAFATEAEAETALADWLAARPGFSNTCTKG